MNKIITIKLLAIGVIVMGFVHIAATFSPMIVDKLAPLSEGMQRACIYFSLMCGAMLILGGCIVNVLCGKANEHPKHPKHVFYACSDPHPPNLGG